MNNNQINLIIDRCIEIRQELNNNSPRVIVINDNKCDLSLIHKLLAKDFTLIITNSKSENIPVLINDADIVILYTDKLFDYSLKYNHVIDVNNIYQYPQICRSYFDHKVGEE